MAKYKKLTRKQALALFEAGVDVEWKGVGPNSSYFEWGSARARKDSGCEVFAKWGNWKDYYRVQVE